MLFRLSSGVQVHVIFLPLQRGFLLRLRNLLTNLLYLRFYTLARRLAYLDVNKKKRTRNLKNVAYESKFTNHVI